MQTFIMLTRLAPDAVKSPKALEDLERKAIEAVKAKCPKVKWKNSYAMKRFVNLMGLFPAGNLVRLNTDELAVVTAEQPDDPFRPQVKVITNRKGETLEHPELVNTWERDSRGEHPRAVVEAVDPDTVGVDPLKYLQP